MENAKQFYEYDSSQDLKNHAELELLRLIDSETPNSLIEIGSGDGHFLNNFKKINSLGIDINPDMVSLAKKNGIEILLHDIRNEVSSSMVNFSPDIVCSNYVFTELNSNDLFLAFKNIYSLLKEGGKLIFTITNPNERDRIKFPGYKLKFENNSNKLKLDSIFSVLLENSSGDYVDVGIRDFHVPLNIFEKYLRESNFKNIKKQFISGNLNYSYAVLYSAKK